jgi:hypothetical protein
MLERPDRELVIGALLRRLPATDAEQILAALAGTPQEALALPERIQLSALRALLEELPPGRNILLASILPIAKKSDEEYLEEILAEQEKADPVFRRRVEAEAKRRGIQRWLVAVLLLYERLGLEDFVAAQRRQQKPEQGQDER